jgi:hypothetical protein
MADFQFVPCPQCQRQFMLGDEFFRIPDAYACCPYCKTEFRVGVAAEKAQPTSEPRPL